ncbi:RusA family crossover junction endodeoxyribonuclease [Fibrella arboris]|uniref:RusA family crossover junction endodeoxyribonuclease n=1 Tax=Fibrella arboris TaxID=3242486 RepID=UPI00352157A6
MIKTRPKSYNSWGSTTVAKKKSYIQRIEKAFSTSYPGHIPLNKDLYGLVYHFYKESGGHDADNISKPVWDCLRGILYDDDKRVKMRIVGSFEMTTDYITVIGSSGLSGKLIAELLDALETEDHLLYVECGTFSPAMIQLNIAQNAN